MIVDYQGVNVYQTDSEILKNVCFHADKGEFIYVVGKVGSGKSSLLKTMYCEVDIKHKDGIKAEVAGRDLTRIKAKEIQKLRKKIGIIFQDFRLLNDRNVYRNLLFVLSATGWKDKKKKQERIMQVLSDVGMTDKKDSMPHELSGGEQQRIAIARALLNEPELIIADEPTGNLDSETAAEIVKLLQDITKTGTAVIMSTHNISLIENYPGIVYRCHEQTLKDVTEEYNEIDIIEDLE